MKALQHLREGKLTIGVASYDFLNDIWIERESGAGHLVSEATARVLIRNKWVELKRFTPRKGEYRLSATGKELTELFCECRFRSVIGRQVVLLSGIDPESTNEKFDWANQRLLCRRCWRRIACAGKFFKHPHGANRLSSLGPICQRHFLNPGRR